MIHTIQRRGAIPPAVLANEHMAAPAVTSELRSPIMNILKKTVAKAFWVWLKVVSFEMSVYTTAGNLPNFNDIYF